MTGLTGFRSWLAVLVLGAGLLVALPAGMNAHQGATGVVKERMQGMKVLGQAMKDLKRLRDAGAAPSADALRDIGARLSAHAGEVLLSRFPEGSAGHPSEAVPEIWRDWEAFSSLAMVLSRRAEALGDAEPTAAVLSSEFRRIGRICKDCHERFRKR